MKMAPNKKLLGRDIGMRSTFCKYDPCVTGAKNSIECEDCMVSLISDRFLGKKFTEEVLSKKYNNTRDLFTYVLIADTIGCNLNCWFCYAWKYLDLEDAKKCMPHFLSAKKLAEKFDCKIRKTADINYLKNRVTLKSAFSDKEKEGILKHLDKELPFSRIRISGGEPLFSNNQVFLSEDKSQNLIKQTIVYWIDFFEELDKLVGQIKKEKLINIATFDSDWQTLRFPVWLTEVEDRIMVRFDTNGIIFSNNEFVNLFYSELFGLFKEKKLKNIHIQIDYSFKGATPKEFMWSQGQQLPTTPENNDKVVNLEKHPQVIGYKNVTFGIEKFIKKDQGFRDCASITIEKGIDHDWDRSKLWLYYPRSMDWQKLSKELGFEFSDVVNCFDLNFGWNFSAKVYRYSNRGANIELSCGSEKVDITSTSIPELMNFRRENVFNKDYMTLVYPAGHKVELADKRVNRELVSPQVSMFEQNLWIISGLEENLRIGIENGLWGVKNTYKDLWRLVKKDDLVFFYCVRPISGIVGYGKVLETYIDLKPFWPNEDPNNESKYPLRIKFQPTNIFQNWQKDRKTLYNTGVDFSHGLNYVEPEKRQLILRMLENGFSSIIRKT